MQVALIPVEGENVTAGASPVEPAPVTPSSRAVKPSTASRNAVWKTAPPGCVRAASTSSWPKWSRSISNVTARCTSGIGAPQISSFPPLRRSVQQAKNWPA